MSSDNDFSLAWRLNDKLFFGPLKDVTAATQATKLVDEVEEFVSELRDYLDNGFSWDMLERVVEESADVLVVLVGALMKLGVSEDMFVEAFLNKTRKNLDRAWVKQANGTFQHDPSKVI